MGEGGARERVEFSPSLGRNEAKRTLRRRGRISGEAQGEELPEQIIPAREEPQFRRRVPAGPIRAGSRTGGRGTFSHARGSTQRVRIGGEPPMHPPLSCTACFSFRRPEPAAAQLPPAPSGLLRPYAWVPAAQVMRLEWQGTSACAPLEVQPRRLEHQIQVPIGVGQGDRSPAQKWGPRRSPAKRVRWGEEEQGSGRSFRRPWAETKQSGLCDDEGRRASLGVSVGARRK